MGFLLALQGWVLSDSHSLLQPQAGDPGTLQNLAAHLPFPITFFFLLINMV